MQDHNGSNPYEGPKAELEDQPAYRSHATFRDSTGLTKWTKRFLYAQIVVAVMAIVSSALEYALLSDFATGAYSSQERAIADGEASDARQSLVGIAQVLVLLISGFLILRWIYIANFNARQLGAAGMVFSPGWSVGWYFIPFANLWKPYQAMKEIWLASSNPQSWKNQPVAPLLRWWWFFLDCVQPVGQRVFPSCNEGRRAGRADDGQPDHPNVRFGGNSPQHHRPGYGDQGAPNADVSAR